MATGRNAQVFKAAKKEVTAMVTMPEVSQPAISSDCVSLVPCLAAVACLFCYLSASIITLRLC